MMGLKTLLNNTVLIFCLLLHQDTISQAIKTNVYRNLEELKNGGWRPGVVSKGFPYDLPSQFHEELAPLDASSSRGVWTGSANGTDFSFILDLSSPQFCGLTFANISVKVYHTEKTKFQVYPCKQDNGDPKCFIEAPSDISWVTANFQIEPDQGDNSKIAQLVGYRSALGAPAYIIVDEVRLTHDGSLNCDQDACNETCEYVAIDCHNYYSCIDYKQKEYHTCDKEQGLAFNPQLGVCDLMEYVEGCEPPTCVCEYRPHLQNCKNYYFCPNSCNVELCELRTCPHELLWSIDAHGDGSEHQQCAKPEIAKCASNLHK